jgi:hypothetical protein
MHETIGDFYISDQDQSSIERPVGVLRGHSADFWAQFNEVAAQNGVPIVAVDGEGLPEDPGAAYQSLFTYEGANVLFALSGDTEQRARAGWSASRVHVSRLGQSGSDAKRNKIEASSLQRDFFSML